MPGANAAGAHEALWSRVAAADFLTVNEKRAAVGYGAVEGADEVKAIDAPRLAEADIERRYNPNWRHQPRVPSGHGDESGRWTDGGASAPRQRTAASTAGQAASGRSNDSRVEANDEVRQPGDLPILVATSDDWVPKIPIERPSSHSARWTAVKDSVRWLVRLGVRASPIGRLITLIEIGTWLYDYAPYIEAYFDSPKTLDELRAAAATPAKGYDIHHLVERTPALKDGYGRDRLDGPDNLVRIPTLKHWELNGWYGRRSERFGGLSPRGYLRGKPWEERVRVGELGLREVGVLAP